MRLDVARGAMQTVAEGAALSNLLALGVTEEDYRLTTSEAGWIAQDRIRVRRTLDALISGTLEITGVDRFELPVEYVAAVLCVFVRARNLLVACKWMETGFQDAESLAREDGGVEVTRAPKLLSLCLLLNSKSSNDIDLARTMFEARTAWKQEQLREPKKERSTEYA